MSHPLLDLDPAKTPSWLFHLWCAYPNSMDRAHAFDPCGAWDSGMAYMAVGAAIAVVLTVIGFAVMMWAVDHEAKDEDIWGFAALVALVSAIVGVAWVLTIWLVPLLLLGFPAVGAMFVRRKRLVRRHEAALSAARDEAALDKELGLA